MDTFQGVPYRCVYESVPRKTTAALTLACLALQPSEFVYVVAADHLIDTKECAGSYKETILKAKDAAANDKIVLFGKHTDIIDSRFGYYADGLFYEKPDKKVVRQLKDKVLLQNIGLMLFQNGVFLNEMKFLQKVLYSQCTASFRRREILSEGVFYSEETLQTIEAVAIEKSLIEKTKKLEMIPIGFSWEDIGSLEDLLKTEYQTKGLGITHECANTIVLNQSPQQAVVVNDLDNVFVVNTTDAVYVGRRGKSHYLKEILHDNLLLQPYSDSGAITYRSWGYYEQIKEEENFRLRKVVILPGRTIYEHSHEARKETWTVIEGSMRVTLDGEAKYYEASETLVISAGIMHQISNICNVPLIMIETATGEILHGGDIISEGVKKVTETDLGLQIDKMIQLQPAYKDYLWGGTKLRDLYGKQCDFDIIAESWELSAHPAGTSIVSSGRHKGLSFSQYLDIVGKNVLGWKCSQSFPLLIKFIDAKQNLSVQVHPNDDYALEYEDEYGKNEMWYVIDAEPNSGLYVGFNHDLDRREVERRVKSNTILEAMNYFPTHPGDVFFIPAGTVHAIGAGNLICEIQQSSNSTYRLYDYDRRDKFGNPRELHLEKALDVLNYKKYEQDEIERENGKIRCKYFEVEIYTIEKEISIQLTDESFYSIICIKGIGQLSIDDVCLPLVAGNSVFIPAQYGTLRVSGIITIALTKI